MDGLVINGDLTLYGVNPYLLMFRPSSNIKISGDLILEDMKFARKIIIYSKNPGIKPLIIKCPETAWPNVVAWPTEENDIDVTYFADDDQRLPYILLSYVLRHSCNLRGIRSYIKKNKEIYKLYRYVLKGLKRNNIIFHNEFKHLIKGN